MTEEGQAMTTFASQKAIGIRPVLGRPYLAMEGARLVRIDLQLAFTEGYRT